MKDIDKLFDDILKNLGIKEEKRSWNITDFKNMFKREYIFKNEYMNEFYMKEHIIVPITGVCRCCGLHHIVECIQERISAIKYDFSPSPTIEYKTHTYYCPKCGQQQRVYAKEILSIKAKF